MRKFISFLTQLTKEKDSFSDIIKDIELSEFNRKRVGGGTQEFYFTFIYKGKQYTLVHAFTYLNIGIEHYFNFKKQNFFELAPFKLSLDEFVELSEILTKTAMKQQFQKTNNEQAFKYDA